MIFDELAGAPRVLWLPGDFPSTNRLLDMQRAAGFYNGRWLRMGGTHVRSPEQSFAKETARIRLHAFGHARRLPKGSEFRKRLRLRFLVMGRDRYDPSAWYLSAKAVEDGLADARVIASDRFDVFDTSGRCVPREENEYVARLTGVPSGRRGMVVLVSEVADGSP